MNIYDLMPRLRFAAQLRYEMHYNQKNVKVTDCRIFYVTEGHGQLQIDGNRYSLQPGCLFYCCAGSIYKISTPEGFSFISLNFDLFSQEDRSQLPISPETEPAKWNTMAVFTDTVPDSGFLNSHLFLEMAGELGETIQNIVQDHSTGDPLSQEMAQTKLKLVLLQLHRSKPNPLPAKLQTVQNYIQDNYRKKITNTELAALVGYHEYHLNRLFLSSTGLTLHEYLLKVRLTQAYALITNTNLPLQTVAEQTGFTAYPHFSNSFRTVYGLSPTQCRKKSNAVIDIHNPGATMQAGR